MNRLVFPLLALFFGVLLTACGGETDSSLTDEDSTAVADTLAEEEEHEAPSTYEGKKAVALWNTSVRETPSDKGKWLATVAFGEEVTLLGDTATTDGRLWVKVRLSDGMEAWAKESLYAVDAMKAVALTKVPLYKRPDFSTPKGESYEAGMIVAIYQEGMEAWREAVGEEKKLKGWVQSTKGFSFEAIDLVVAAQRKLAKSTAAKDLKKGIEQYEQLLELEGITNSKFYDQLIEELNELKARSTESINEKLEAYD